MAEKIFNCFDSHVHFWATGKVAHGLKLDKLKNVTDVGSIKIEPDFFQNQWLTGFGWNQFNWLSAELPNKKLLDQYFGSTPVFFSRADGHASWINTAAILELTKLGYDFSKNPQGGVIDRNSNGELTGLLFDQAHINALMKLPQHNKEQNLSFYLTAQKIFNQAGFTHIRDLSMTSDGWSILKSLEDQNKLTVAIDSFITAESIDDLSKVIAEIKKIKNENAKQLKLSGVKIFIDGSLGSKTAYLSENYLGTETKGILIWSYEDIKQLIKATWKENLDVAIHTIGDEAVHTAVKAAREVSAEGVLGRLHLEHVQLLRTETVQMMKPLHIFCYMQPCHWLSDQVWLKQSLPEKLIANLFQWELLRKNKIPIFWGSDSPIETTSIFNTEKALLESAKWGIKSYGADWKQNYSYSDLNWNSSYTEIKNNQIVSVVFNGNKII